ncbi:MAG TPA: aminotransferase class V-fold PLP-dependent enzyme [Candidatus Melainabacteria bacterium]|nr:aminotransferase class V-fold PLP-dependent enzyme [Candidatus Melainabacteria bacterium]
MTSAAGPLPKPAYETYVEFGSLLHLTGSVKFPRWIEYMEKSRLSASRLLGASKENIAFVKNTGIGLWIASRLIDWKHGDEIVLPAGEFPSNIYPWLSLEEQGVSIKWIEPNLKDHPIPRVDRESILPLLTERTKLLAVSFVQFDDGARRNMQELSGLAKEYGLVFVVDAIQGLGALPFDLTDFDADFVCAGSQKWLLAAPGAGLLYIAPKWLEVARVPNFGWLSVDDPFNTAPGSSADCHKRLLSTAKRFEEGTPNFAGIATLGASIDYLLDYGIENISSKIKSLTNFLVERLKSLDCRVVSPRDREDWSGIVSFYHPSLDSQVVDREFNNVNIITSVRNDWVRVAVDFFNDEEEIERLVASLKSQLDRAVVA